MDEETKKGLDNLVKEFQSFILGMRFQALEPSDLQKHDICTYAIVIDRINAHFYKDYLSKELFLMRLTNSEGCVFNELPSILPLRKKDKNAFEIIDKYVKT